jgi:hypothetical protein
MEDMNKLKQRLSDEEQNLLAIAKIRNEKMYQEQLKYQREQKIIKDNLRIVQLEREISFKLKEIAGQKSTEVHDGFIDRIKPLHFIENDIEQLQYEITVIKHGIKNMKEEQAKENVQ